MEQTKITVKVWQELLDLFNDEINSNFIKKDAFLNQMINLEVKELAKEMAGVKLSNDARSYIAGELKRLGTKVVNINIDKATAKELARVVKETNICRDAFINRLIYFILGTPNALKLLKLPTYISHPILNPAESMLISPLPAIRSIMGNPLSYLSIAHNKKHGHGLYTTSDPISPHLHGLCCNIDDIYVPGTKEFIGAEALVEKL